MGRSQDYSFRALNFFQPVMKLVEQIPDEVKEELKGIYLSLNPAQLKKSIDVATKSATCPASSLL